MSRLFIVFFLISFFANISYANVYDMSVPLEGDSIANNTLQFRVLKNIYPIASELNPLCTDFKVTNTQLLHYPYDVVKKNNKYVKGYWKELWTVSYCGQKIQVPITFKINKKSVSYNIEKI